MSDHKFRPDRVTSDAFRWHSPYPDSRLSSEVDEHPMSDAERKRAEAMARAEYDMTAGDGEFDDLKPLQKGAILQPAAHLGRVLDAYFAHTVFQTVRPSWPSAMRFTAEPRDE